MKRAHSFILALSLTALVACGDDAKDPIASGPSKTFSASVTGDLAKALSGPAMFGADTNEAGAPIFAVALGSPTSDDVLLLVREGSTRPGTGAYEFADPFGDTPSGQKWTAIYIIGEGDELVGMFVAESGTLTISESTGQRLKATFQFQGSGFLADDFESELSIAVSGSFDAGAAPNAGVYLNAVRAAL